MLTRSAKPEEVIACKRRIEDAIKAAAIMTLPTKSNMPKKGWISTPTWQTMLAIKKSRAALKQIAQPEAGTVMGKCFAAWAHAAGHKKAGTTRPAMMRACLEKAIGLGSEQVKRQLRHDRETWIAEVTAGAQEALHSGNTRQFFQTRKILAQRTARPMPGLSDAEGNLITTPELIDKRWMQHWQTILGGELVEEDIAKKLVDIDCEGHMQRLTPSLATVERLLAWLPTEKAAGPDQLAPMLLRKGAKEIAGDVCHLYSIILEQKKAPLQWAGGIITPIYKGKGAMRDPSSHRGVSLQDFLAKTATRALLAEAMEQVPQSLPDTQCATPGKGCQIATLLTRTWMMEQDARKRSYVMIWVDIAKAFDSVPRQLLWQRGADDSPSLLEQAGLSAEIIALVKASHGPAWLTQKGAAQMLNTQRGVKQGDPLSMYLYAAIHASITAEIKAEAATKNIEFNDDLDNYETGYVDDTAYGVSASTAAEALHMCAVLADIVVNTFERFHMKLNFGVGKTCIMARLIGRGAKTLRTDMWKAGVEAGQTEAMLITPEHRQLKVVDQYKHLGVMLTAPVNMRVEVAYRTGRAYSALKEIKKMTRSDKISAKAKWQLINAVVVSQLLFGAESWPEISVPCWRKLQAAYHKAVRSAVEGLHRQRNERITNQQAREMVGASQLQVLVDRRRRLHMHAKIQKLGGYVAQVMRSSRKDSWISMVRVARDRIWRGSPKLAEMPDPAIANEAWDQLARDHPESWKAILRLGWHVTELEQDDAEDSEDMPLDQWRDRTLKRTCPDCGEIVKCTRALPLHRARAHGWTDPAAAYVRGGECPVCHGQFGDRLCARFHLRRCRPCWQFVMDGHLEPLSEAEQEQLRLLDKALATQKARSGISRYKSTVPGPKQGPKLYDDTGRPQSCAA
eukprot:3658843-Amphidinium_carterae.3